MPSSGTAVSDVKKMLTAGCESIIGNCCVSLMDRSTLPCGVNNFWHIGIYVREIKYMARIIPRLYAGNPSLDNATLYIGYNMASIIATLRE